MKLPVILSAGLIVLAGCSGGSKVATDQNGVPVIDLVSAISSPSGIKASQLGSTITYIPLETNDSSLIGDKYKIYPDGDRLVVATNNRCLVFDMNTGKYLNSVSQYGQGPEDFRNNTPAIDEQNHRILFQQGKHNLISFTPDNKFVETVIAPVKHEKVTYALPHEGNYLYHVTGNFNDVDPHTLLMADASGNVIDSLTLYAPAVATVIQPEKIANISVFTTLLGNIGGAYALINDKDGGSTLSSGNIKTMWHAGDNTRIHVTLTDTIYNYTDGKLSPAYIFNTGEHHYPTESGFRDPAEEEITVHSIFETDNYILSGILYGSMPKYPEYYPDGYYALYNKNDGSCSVQSIDISRRADPIYSGENSGIADDINHFIPIEPSAVTPAGALLATVTVDKLLAWLEDHPDFKAEGALGFINDLDPEANPILIIIK